tara:strand:- start:603 stop:1025 length:423 start_codon:yes stop_codon:yes gene_type:complete
MDKLNQGAQANLNGKMFEDRLEYVIQQFTNKYEKQVAYTNLYDSDRARMDFTINDGIDINIEAKYQKVSGSVDEKIPFCIENLLKQDKDGLLVLGGHHFYTPRGEKILAWAKKKLKGERVSIIRADKFKAFLTDLFEANL